MTEPLKTNPHQELINAAKGFMLDVFGKAPKKAMCGMTPNGLFQALCDMSPEDAERQCKSSPDGAASIRLAQAIRQAEAHPTKVCDLCRREYLTCPLCSGRGGAS
jgi:hypothetical protein